jgi:hypothetical protein
VGTSGSLPRALPARAKLQIHEPGRHTAPRVGTGLVIAGKRETVAGLDVSSWLDMPDLRLRKNEDFRQRNTTWIRQIVLHTTKGIPGGDDQRPQDIRAGLGPATDAGEAVARWWSKDPTPAGAHLVVDFDGRIYCCCDLFTEAAQHAKHANQTSVGIEIYQGREAELYEGQLDVVVRLCDALTRRFGIQRQIPHRYLGPVRRLMDSVEDVVGVIGHRDLDRARGAGDPGSAVFYRLGLAGYEPWDFSLSEERDVWRRRQRDLGIDPADGIAGPVTVSRLREKGHAHGLWVSRPGDEGAPAA